MRALAVLLGMAAVGALALLAVEAVVVEFVEAANRGRVGLAVGEDHVRIAGAVAVLGLGRLQRDLVELGRKGRDLLWPLKHPHHMWCAKCAGRTTTSASDGTATDALIKQE